MSKYNYCAQINIMCKFYNAWLFQTTVRFLFVGYVGNVFIF